MITVVEPHPDDAWLSLGWTIEQWIGEGRPVRIVTVYSEPRRAAESAAYAREVGASHVALGLPPHGGGLKGGWFCEPPPAVVLPEDRTGTWVWPLGLEHPEHRAVALLGLDSGLIHASYLDLPYATKQKNRSTAHRLLAGRGVRTFVPPSARKWRHEAIYKSQSLFMHRNRDSIFRMPEMTVGPPVDADWTKRLLRGEVEP